MYCIICLSYLCVSNVSNCKPYSLTCINMKKSIYCLWKVVFPSCIQLLKQYASKSHVFWIHMYSYITLGHTMNLELHFEGLRITHFQVVYSNSWGLDSRESWSDGKSTVHNGQGQQINPCLCSPLPACCSIIALYLAWNGEEGSFRTKLTEWVVSRGGRPAERAEPLGN